MELVRVYGVLLITMRSVLSKYTKTDTTQPNEEVDTGDAGPH